MNYEKVELVVNNQEQIFEIGKVAKQAQSSVLFRSGNTVILAALTYNDDEIIEEDFTPLVVQYLEKAYAVGKIPAGFVKREQKPGDFETLTARIIDRSIRPLFPKGYAYNTAITTTVFSTDSEADLQTAALNASSIALYLSDLPIEKVVYGVRIAKVDGEYILNPTMSQLKESAFDLYVSGTQDELLMIEFKAQGQTEVEIIDNVGDLTLENPIEEVEIYKTNEIDEKELIEVLKIAQKAIKDATDLYIKAFENIKREKKQIELRKDKLSEELVKYIKDKYFDQIEESISHLAKSERESILKKLTKKIIKEDLVDEDFDAVLEAVKTIKREIVRNNIITKHIRADGRGLTDIRPITIETNILPSAHGSCLFTRGQTQALAVATLGGEMDAQVYENLTSDGSQLERFMLHYNFPSYSVGETERLGPPSRRELGHGNLAKRAIEPLLPPDYDKTVRVVSEILESNGSSSMATVCASSLAMKACKVPLIKLSAGIAMGLIIEGEEYAILSDIMGLEDHDGDMDFKVAGTRDGITAMQMDIKLGGIKLEILEEALMQAKDGRNIILDLMESAEREIVYNEKVLPHTIDFQVAKDKIIDIIGQGGKTIKSIIDKFAVAIDLDRENGKVSITGKNKDLVNEAKNYIEKIVIKTEPEVKFEVGQVLKGKVNRITNFGAFIELPGGVEGLMHISKVSNDRVEDINDVLKVGDEIEVKVLSQKGFKIELAAKDYKAN